MRSCVHSGVPYSQIAAILAACAAANWAIFDRTKQGLLLATLCGLAAPVSELLLMKVFHVWHYPRPGELQLHPRLPYASWLWTFPKEGLQTSLPYRRSSKDVRSDLWSCLSTSCAGVQIRPKAKLRNLTLRPQIQQRGGKKWVKHQMYHILWRWLRVYLEQVDAQIWLLAEWACRPG